MMEGEFLLRFLIKIKKKNEVVHLSCSHGSTPEWLERISILKSFAYSFQSIEAPREVQFGSFEENDELIDESVNQSMNNQNYNQSMNQNYNQSMNQNYNQSVNNQSYNQSMNQNYNQSMNNQTMNESTNQTFNQSINKSMNQSMKQSTNKPYYPRSMSQSRRSLSKSKSNQYIPQPLNPLKGSPPREKPHPLNKSRSNDEVSSLDTSGSTDQNIDQPLIRALIKSTNRRITELETVIEQQSSMIEKYKVGVERQNTQITKVIYILFIFLVLLLIIKFN